MFCGFYSTNSRKGSAVFEGDRHLASPISSNLGPGVCILLVEVYDGLLPGWPSLNTPVSNAAFILSSDLLVSTRRPGA